MKRSGRAAVEKMRAEGDQPPDWDDLDELEEAVDGWHSLFLERRGSEAEERCILEDICHRLDTVIRTNVPEFIDLDTHPEEEKLREIEAVSGITRSIGGYDLFCDVLEPHVERALERQGQKGQKGQKGHVDILEVASGYGDMAFELAERFEGREVEITGSDIEEAYVREANASAEKRGLDVSFGKVDALDLFSNEESYDVVFIAQSLHHFSPGQLARVIAGGSEVGEVFVAIDGKRTLAAPLLMATFTLPYMNPYLVHDGLVSGRKMYSEVELESIARIAAPDSCISTRWEYPGYSVLTVGKD
ncbi:MAG: class I SAM-dependent methyltransferase [Halobacteria archaeon]